MGEDRGGMISTQEQYAFVYQVSVVYMCSCQIACILLQIILNENLHPSVSTENAVTELFVP